MTVTDVGETDFAVIVFREEDQWEADALPAVVTADLDDFVQALRRPPSIGGTIGFAGVDDFFFVAVRILGDDGPLFLSDLTAAAANPSRCCRPVTWRSSRPSGWTRWNSARSRPTSTSTQRTRWPTSPSGSGSATRSSARSISRSGRDRTPVTGYLNSFEPAMRLALAEAAAAGRETRPAGE